MELGAGLTILTFSWGVESNGFRFKEIRNIIGISDAGLDNLVMIEAQNGSVKKHCISPQICLLGIGVGGNSL